MSGKKLINNPETVVDEALEGLTMIHPGLRLLEGHRVVIREEVNTHYIRFSEKCQMLLSCISDSQ